MKFVFWGKYLDTYLSDTLRRLEALAGEPIRYALVEDRFTRRGAAGEEPQVSAGALTVMEKRGFSTQAKRILEDSGDAVHLFLSFWGDKRLFRVLLRSLWQQRRVAVIFEPYAAVPVGYWKDEPKWLSRLEVLSRHIAYRGLWPLLRLAARGTSPCVLAVSPLAEKQLRRVGFPEAALYPFGYFVERKAVTPVKEERGEQLRAVFSGSLIQRKGLDIAIAALKQVNEQGARVTLDIYGPGVNPVRTFQETSTIRYRGVYPQGDGQRVLSGYQLLLVPSRHEGWGLVVNEALMQGVPVVASDRVGAGCLVEDYGAGAIFKSGDSTQLAEVLRALAANPVQLERITSACANLDEQISPSTGADYLVKVVRYHFDQTGERPPPPWRARK